MDEGPAQTESIAGTFPDVERTAFPHVVGAARTYSGGRQAFREASGALAWRFVDDPRATGESRIAASVPTRGGLTWKTAVETADHPLPEA